jgi:hypothetical protein
LDIISWTIWHPWLGYFGLILGLVAAAIFGVSLARSALIGLAAGIVLAAVVNIAVSNPAPCLEQSKGWDILRAYQVNCIYKPLVTTPLR